MTPTEREVNLLGWPRVIEARDAEIARLQEQVETLKGSLTLAELERKAAIETAKSAVQESYRAAEYLDRAEAAEAERDRLLEGCRIYAVSLRGPFSTRYEVAEGLEILAALQKEPQP